MHFSLVIRAAALPFFLVVSPAVATMAQEVPEPPFPAVDPIPMKEGGYLEKDFRTEEHAWARRLMLSPAQKTWEGKPWAQEAGALMEEALELMDKEHQDPHSLAPLAGRFRELLKKASGEPLLQVFGARALFGEREDWRESVPLLEKALGSGRLGGSLEVLASSSRWLIAEREGIDNDMLQDRWLNALVRTLSDESYDEASQTVLVRHHVMALNLMEHERPEPLEKYGRNVNASRLPPWIKLTLRGQAEKHLAWVKRSLNLAYQVNDEQWKGFAEHLKTARDLLGEAARLRPDRPEAAAAMIPVAMGEGVDNSELRAWFDRAVSAQFDYATAYKALLWAYRPRWSGSHELMLAFGKACAATKRYDTIVPSRLMTAAMNVTEELFEPSVAFRHGAVRSAMIEMSRGYLEHSPSAPALTRHILQSDAAMCANLADDNVLAQKALDAAGPRLHRSTRLQLNAMLMHETALRAEVAADVGAYGPAIRTAANPAPGTSLEKIHTSLMEVEEKGLPPEALAYLQEGRELTGMQKAVEAGGWVDVRFHQHLISFFQSEEGEWKVEPEGVLVCQGTDHPRSRLVLKASFGPDVEMRGEIAFDIPETVEKSQFGCGIAPMLHWLPTCANAGVRTILGHLGDGSACAKAYCDSLQNTTPTVHFRLQEWNSFSIRAAGGKLSYDVNGRTMATGYDMARLGLEVDSGLLGFAAYRLPIGGKARIRNVAIRKITSADLAAIPVPTTVAAESLSKDMIPDWLWKAALIGLLVLAAIFGPRLIRPEEE